MRGDERAFATIYERHHQGLFRYCRSILRNRRTRATRQSTMSRRSRNMATLSDEDALKPWLYRIAHNESISLLLRGAAEDEMATRPDSDARRRHHRRGPARLATWSLT